MSVAVPPSVRQVVLFSSGPWGERICVNAELNDADRFPITIGKLTPYNKYGKSIYRLPLSPNLNLNDLLSNQPGHLISCRCLSWEQWEEETWTDSVTLNVTLEGGNLVNVEETLNGGLGVAKQTAIISGYFVSCQYPSNE